MKNKSTEQLQAELLVLKNQADKLADRGESALAEECDTLVNAISAELERRNPPQRLTVDGPGNQAPGTKLYGITAEGQRIPIYGKGERMAPAGSDGEGWLAGFVRNSLGLTSKGIKNSVLERDSALVPVAVTQRIVDGMRAKARLLQAGALTIPITGPTNFVRIDADPTVYQHAEGADDIQESLPTLGKIEADPETLAALIPISLELAQDSPNLDSALNVALAGAFAGKLDSLGITALLADESLNESSSGEDTQSWAGVMAAVGSALSENMDVPGAFIANAGDWALRNGERWDIDGEGALGAWLAAPPVLRDMLDLPTTAMSTGHAIFGDFARGVAVIIRQDLRLELVRWAKPGYGSHILAAYMRAEVYTMQGGALYHQLKTV